MRKSYLMRRPQDDEDDEDLGAMGTVAAKPIDERYARRLGASYRGRDFVKASASSQRQFYGSQHVIGADATNDDSTTSSSGNAAAAVTTRPLTHDERNKISARIVKAELKGDAELARKLKEKLEAGHIVVGGTADEAPTAAASTTSGNKAAAVAENSVLLLRVDKRSGLIAPARGDARKTVDAARDDGGNDSRGASAYDRRNAELGRMRAEEKAISADEQMAMFSREAMLRAHVNDSDECEEEEAEAVSAPTTSHPKKRRRQHARNEREQRASDNKRIKGMPF